MYICLSKILNSILIVLVSRISRVSRMSCQQWMFLQTVDTTTVDVLHDQSQHGCQTGEPGNCFIHCWPDKTGSFLEESRRSPSVIVETKPRCFLTLTECFCDNQPQNSSEVLQHFSNYWNQCFLFNWQTHEGLLQSNYSCKMPNTEKYSRKCT